MHSPPLHQWFHYQEARGLYRLTYYVPEESDSALSILRNYWDNKIIGLEEARRHKWGGHVRHGRCDGLDKKLFFKRFSIRSFRYIHKPPRARATVLQEERLAKAGFVTAKTYGLIELRFLGVLVDSVVVSEELADFTPLNLYLRDEPLRHGLPLKRRWKLARSLGEYIGRCHRAGFFHGDMHVANIMCTLGDDEIDFAWIDNEEGKQYSQLPMRKRINDLHHMNRAKFGAPTSDRFRFWDGYTSESGLSEDELQRLRTTLARMATHYQLRKGID